MDWVEKRQYKRAYIRFPVECRSKSSWQVIEARDISAGGMFVATEKIEPPNTEIEAMFNFGTSEDDRQFMRAEGIVVWVRPKESQDEQGNTLPVGMGIKFNKLQPISAKDFIDQVVKKIEKKKDA